MNADAKTCAARAPARLFAWLSTTVPLFGPLRSALCAAVRAARVAVHNLSRTYAHPHATAQTHKARGPHRRGQDPHRTTWHPTSNRTTRFPGHTLRSFNSVRLPTLPAALGGGAFSTRSCANCHRASSSCRRRSNRSPPANADGCQERRPARGARWCAAGPAARLLRLVPDVLVDAAHEEVEEAVVRHPHLHGPRARCGSGQGEGVRWRSCGGWRACGAVEVRPPSEVHRLQLTVPFVFMYCALCHTFRSAPRPNTCDRRAPLLHAAIARRVPTHPAARVRVMHAPRACCPR